MLLFRFFHNNFSVPVFTTFHSAFRLDVVLHGDRTRSRGLPTGVSRSDCEMVLITENNFKQKTSLILIYLCAGAAVDHSSRAKHNTTSSRRASNGCRSSSWQQARGSRRCSAVAGGVRSLSRCGSSSTDGSRPSSTKGSNVSVVVLQVQMDACALKCLLH